MNRGCLFALLILGISLMVLDMSCWPVSCMMGHHHHGRRGVIIRGGHGRYGGGGWFRGGWGGK